MHIRMMSPSAREESKSLTRRAFLKKACSAGGAALLSAMFRPAESRGEDMYQSEAKRAAGNLSLREIVQRKLHHGPKRFINIFSRVRHGNLLRVLRWKLFAKNRLRQFYSQESVFPVKVDWHSIDRHKHLSITFLKHSSLVIKDGGDYIYIDPVFSKISHFIYDFTPFEFDRRDLPRPCHVLITHGHYDHLHKASLAHFDKKTQVITPLGYQSIFRELDMRKHDQLDWFDTLKQGRREITLLPCHHWTMRNPFTGPNTALWGSFLIKTATGPTIYVSGDTAYFDRFKEIGREYPIDLAIFNLGAYEPRWFMKDSHINPAETVRAFRELGAKRLMIVHWGSFRLGDEPVHFPPLHIKQEMQKAGLIKRYVPIRHGQTLFYDILQVT